MSNQNASNRDTFTPNLPMLVGASSPRERIMPLVRPGAAFAAHLVAARDRLEPQRINRRAGAPVAQSAYQSAGARLVRRMPMGYRLDQSA